MRQAEARATSMPDLHDALHQLARLFPEIGELPVQLSPRQRHAGDSPVTGRKIVNQVAG
jgi:hypothetical protein